MYSEHFQTFKIESFAKKNNVWVQLSNQKIFRGMGEDGVVETYLQKHVDCFGYNPEREGASHYPAFMGSCLTIGHMW